MSDEGEEVEVNAAGKRIIRAGTPEANAIKENTILHLIGVINEVPEVAEASRDSENPRLAEAASAALARFRAEGKWAPKPPTPWSYWVAEDKRILAGQYPGDLDKATAAVKLTQLVCAGVTKFVDLTEPGELRPYDQLLHKHFPDIEYVRVSVKDVTTLDEVQMTIALKEITQAPGLVYVHCRGGCGRTGQVLGCYLIEQGYEPIKALQEVQILTRPLWGDRLEDCPQTAAQKQVVLNWKSQKERLSYGSEPVRLEVAEPRIRGCLLGGAVGDALGAGIEFDSIAQIRAKFGPAGVTGMTEAYGRVGAITDDTQMTLFTAEGLLRASSRGHGRGIYPDIASVLDHAYSRWLLTQGIRPPHWEQLWRDYGEGGPAGDGWLLKVQGLRHRRAPGNTCLSALQASVEFNGEKAHNDSKGCGGVMRAAPVGLIAPPMYLITDDDFDRSAFGIGDRIAAVTHGHPTGHLAAGVLGDVIYGIVWHSLSLEDALDHAERILSSRPGHHETLDALRSARRLAAAGSPPSTETIAQLGEGWVAEEALAIAIYCALVAKDFRHGVLLAVNHSGDSDSTGAIAGNLLGAILSFDAIPAEWLSKLELRHEINSLADDWIRFSADPNALAGEYSGDELWRKRYPGW